MSEYIASVDAGNGGVNAVLAKGTKKIKTFYVPSVRAIAYGDGLGLGSDLELEYEFVDWYGHRYVVGDDVLSISRQGIERHVGSNRYGSEFHQFLVAYALAKLGIRTGEVDLTLFTPPGLYQETATKIRDSFMDKDGEIAIRLSGDRKPRRWRYSNVRVLPEGVGAVVCNVLNDAGEMVPSTILNGDNLVADLGVYTVDALKIQDGKFNFEHLRHATWPGKGVDMHIRQKILHTLHNQDQDFSVLDVEDIDLAIRTGLATGDYSIRKAGKVANIKPQLDKERLRFASWIANTVIDGRFDGLRGIKSVFLVGGGATLVADHMEEWYGSKITNLKNNPLTKKVHPVNMNAIGGLRLSRMKRGGNNA